MQITSAVVLASLAAGIVATPIPISTRSSDDHELYARGDAGKVIKDNAGALKDVFGAHAKEHKDAWVDAKQNGGSKAEKKDHFTQAAAASNLLEALQPPHKKLRRRDFEDFEDFEIYARGDAGKVIKDNAGALKDVFGAHAKEHKDAWIDAKQNGGSRAEKKDHFTQAAAASNLVKVLRRRTLDDLETLEDLD